MLRPGPNMREQSHWRQRMSERRFAIIEERLDRIDEKLEQLRQMYARHQSLIEPNKKPLLGTVQAGAFDAVDEYSCYGCATGRCSAHQDGPLGASHDEFLKAKYWD